jgi:hypothetical protein
MSAICPPVFSALGRKSNYVTLPPPLLRRGWTKRSWRSRFFGWMKSLVGSNPRHALAEPMKGTEGPGEPSGETEIASCMYDPVFWMTVAMH